MSEKRKNPVLSDEAYKGLQRAFQQSSYLLGIEEALDAIRGDTQLQSLLRTYAQRNGIEKREWAEYGVGNPLSCNFVDCRIKFFETRNKEVFLTLHPDFNEEIMPLFYNYWYEARHGSGCFADYEGHFLIVRRKKGYYLKGDP